MDRKGKREISFKEKYGEAILWLFSYFKERQGLLTIIGILGAVLALFYQGGFDSSFALYTDILRFLFLLLFGIAIFLMFISTSLGIPKQEDNILNRRYRLTDPRTFIKYIMYSIWFFMVINVASWILAEFGKVRENLTAIFLFFIFVIIAEKAIDIILPKRSF